MNNIKFNDWQEMALKKDTEAIIKKLSSQEPIFFSLCWEIVLAIGAIIVDHLFDTEAVSVHVWIICVVLAVLPPLVILVVKITKWVIVIRQVQAGKYNVRSFVDTFDNQICYWVMMSNSYSRILSDSASRQKTERIFLYQEGSYYNNKSIQALYSMKPVIDKVFSNDSKTIIENNIVAVYRLLNILEMIHQHQATLDKCIEDIKSDDLIVEQQRINSAVQERITQFIDDINAVFGTHCVWNQPNNFSEKPNE